MPTHRRLVSSLPTADLRRRLRATDAAVLDVDGSLHRGITQGVVALGLLRRIAWTPEVPADRGFLLPAALAGVALTAKWFIPGRHRNAGTARQMIDVWCRSFRGVPMFYFHRAALKIPGRSFAGVRETVERLGQRGPVGIVSVGLSVIVNEYVRQFARDGQPLITFQRCNRMVSEVQDRREVFAGRYADPVIATPTDKAAAGREFFDSVAAQRPLVVGNDEGDVQLARLAQQRGGLAIGVRPPRRLRHVFDAYLTRGDWRPLAVLLE